MRRSAPVLLALVLGLGALAPAQAASVVSEGEAARLDAIFRDAATRWDVPVQVLQALAVQESGMRSAPRVPELDFCGAHHGEGQGAVGVMGLRHRGEHGATIHAAAAAAGLSEAVVAALTEANVQAAAALLRQMAGPHARVDVPEDWWAAVAAWSGLDGASSDGYAADVMQTVHDGRLIELIDGTRVLIPAAGNPTLKDRIQGARAAIPPSQDYGPAAYTAACSSNYTGANRKKGDINYVVIHTMQGSYSGSISWFANCSSQVSAHYSVKSSNGAITQSVLEKDIAWHAGYWSYNEQSIGIEHEGYVSDASWYTDAMYKESAKLTAAICDKYGIPKDRKHIIGHHEVPGCPNPNGGGAGCHTDPGSNWDWDKYMGYVTGGGGTPPPPTTGVLMGFIREGDVFSGPNIAGATIALSTGQTATTGGDGLYKFTIPPGTYTVTASAGGYETKSEEKIVEAGVDNWKSMALTKSAPPPDPVPDPDPEPDPDPVPDPEPDPDPDPVPDPEPDPSVPVSMGAGHWEPAVPSGDDFAGLPSPGGGAVSVGPNHWAPGNAGYSPSPTGGSGGFGPGEADPQIIAPSAASSGCSTGGAPPSGAAFALALLCLLALRRRAA